jgi:hypothetical protein
MDRSISLTSVSRKKTSIEEQIWVFMGSTFTGLRLTSASSEPHTATVPRCDLNVPDQFLSPDN